MAITHVSNEEEYKKEVEDSTGVVIVDFWAPWCGPCKMLGPVFEAMSDSEEYKDVKFVKVDVDEAEELGAKFRIMSIPTLYVYKDGEKVADKAGALNKDGLKEFIDSNK